VGWQVVLHVYSSASADVRYVTDPGVERCGTLRLHLQATPTAALDSAPGAGLGRGRRREIQTRMMFGETEIRVSALDVVTGTAVRATIDFLNK